MVEGRDWVRMQTESCPDCGWDPDLTDWQGLPRLLTDTAAAWGARLARTDAGLLRIRPRPGVWSTLEYAGHTRDVLAVFADRVEATLTHDDPELEWWDHEAAVVDHHRADAVLLTEALTANARRLAAVAAPLSEGQRMRPARRRAGERFTAEGLVRFAAHEQLHHLHDVDVGLADLRSGP